MSKDSSSVALSFQKKTAWLAAALLLAASLATEGCSTVAPGGPAEREPQKLDLQYEFDLDENGRPDFHIMAYGFRPQNSSEWKVMGLQFYVPDSEVNEGNALAVRRKPTESDGGVEDTPPATFDEGSLIGPETIGSRNSSSASAEETLAWGDKAQLCTRYAERGDKRCNGAVAGRKAYLGLRLGRGDTARYGWARLEVDTTRKDSTGFPVVLLHGYDVGEPGEPIRAGARP